MFLSGSVLSISASNYLTKFPRLLLTVLVCGFSPILHAAETTSMPGTDIILELQNGGYVLYIRHGATDHSAQDKDLRDFKKCNLQRNLSQQGKDESGVMGEAIKALNIKIDGVYTSPYCRCVDTAKIAFGEHEIVQELQASSASDPAESAMSLSYLKTQLSLIPKQGFNTVLVGHTANLREVTGVWPKPEGVAHVFKPLGDGDYQHIGHIKPNQWSDLAR